MSNTTISLLQMLNQNIITTFKRYYPQFYSILVADQKEIFATVIECWKFCSVSDCIVNTRKFVDDLESTALNGCWKKVWLETIGDSLTSRMK
jgi:hypothetical protein